MWLLGTWSMTEEHWGICKYKIFAVFWRLIGVENNLKYFVNNYTLY